MSQFLIIISGRNSEEGRDWAHRRFPAQHNDPRKVIFIETKPDGIEWALDSVEGQFFNKAETVVFILHDANQDAINKVYQWIRHNEQWTVEWRVFEFSDQRNDFAAPEEMKAPAIWICQPERSRKR